MEELRQQVKQLRQENAELRQKNAEMLGLLAGAEQKIKELTGMLNQNSRNSSWPSSRDKGKKRTKSRRKKSNRPVGGQKGHKGHTLEARTKPAIKAPISKLNPSF